MELHSTSLVPRFRDSPSKDRDGESSSDRIQSQVQIGNHAETPLLHCSTVGLRAPSSSGNHLALTSPGALVEHAMVTDNKGNMDLVYNQEPDPSTVLTPTKRKAGLFSVRGSDPPQKKPKCIGAAHVEAPKQLSRSTQTTYVFEPPLKPGDSLAILEHPIMRTGGNLGTWSTSRKVAGRPTKRAARAKQISVPKYLRTSKPVVTLIPIDVWQNILAFCPLSFLIKARQVCRDFRAALAYEATWKKARLHVYGMEQPDPPAGLTEMQYADLLTGIGCQSKSCPDQKARKTYWAFPRRWCESCLRQKLLMSNAIMPFITKYPGLPEYIRPAAFDHWDNYQFAGTYQERPEWAKTPAHRTGYERLAIAQAIQDIDHFLEKNLGQEEQNSWFSRKENARDETMQELQHAEAFFELWKRKKNTSTKGLKEKRATFFQQRALAMNPPLDLAAITKMPSYLRSIIISKEPSERSWLMLQPKLEQERAAAEKLEKRENMAPELVEQRQRKALEYLELRDRRNKYLFREQFVVLTIADSVIRRLGIKDGDSDIDDRDLIHIILRGVYTKYYELSEADKPKGKNGSYRLLMDDAKLVYEMKIEPIFSSWKNYPRSTVAKELKCPGCTRKDVNTRWKFEELFNHIYERHAHQAGDFSFWRIDPAELPRLTNFPWCRIEWPSNLPMLAVHQKSSGRWNPNSDSEYECSPPSYDKIPHHDAFHSRCVSFHMGPPGTEFVGNVLYAAEQLRGSKLGAKFRTQIVFQFALQKYRSTNGGSPDFEVLDALQLALLREKHYDLFERFRCSFCCEQPVQSKNNKFVNRDQPFGELIQHYRSGLHTSWHPMSEWTNKLILFPTAEHLSAALVESGNEEALRVFVELFPRQEVTFLDPALQRSLFVPADHRASLTSATPAVSTSTTKPHDG